MEAMHAWENVEFGVEEGFEALLAFVAGVNFNATIFDKTKLVFQLISIGGVAVHEIFKSVDFLAVGFQGLADLVFEVFDFYVLVEVGEEIFDLYDF